MQADFVTFKQLFPPVSSHDRKTKASLQKCQQDKETQNEKHMLNIRRQHSSIALAVNATSVEQLISATKGTVVVNSKRGQISVKKNQPRFQFGFRAVPTDCLPKSEQHTTACIVHPGSRSMKAIVVEVSAQKCSEGVAALLPKESFIFFPTGLR